MGEAGGVEPRQAWSEGADPATAARQIEIATVILGRHRPGPDGCCSCGRSLPCSVAATCERTREQYQAALVLSQTTVVLPVVVPGRRWRPFGT